MKSMNKYLKRKLVVGLITQGVIFAVFGLMYVTLYKFIAVR